MKKYNHSSMSQDELGMRFRYLRSLCIAMNAQVQAQRKALKKKNKQMRDVVQEMMLGDNDNWGKLIAKYNRIIKERGELLQEFWASDAYKTEGRAQNELKSLEDFIIAEVTHALDREAKQENE